MSKNRNPQKWKLGKIMERAREAWTSPLVWWVRETEANRKIKELEVKVWQLVEAGDFMELCLTHNEPFRSDAKAKWRKAKEAYND